MSKQVIATKTANCVETLIDALKSLTLADPGTVYVEGRNGGTITMHLVEETLTDGSIVYNIVFGEINS